MMQTTAAVSALASFTPPEPHPHPGYTIHKGTAARRRLQVKRHTVQAQQRHINQMHSTTNAQRLRKERRAKRRKQ